MNASLSTEDRIGRLEHSVAEIFPDIKTIAGVHESHLHLILMLFQSLQRYRDEYVNSLRLIATDPAFSAAASRNQIMDQIARYQMESDFMNGAMKDTLTKLCGPQLMGRKSSTSAFRTGL